MELSNHAQQRSQQRGIPQELIELIVEHGKPVRRPGEVFEYKITAKQAQRMIDELNKEKQILMRLSGQRVLVSFEDDEVSVVTVYHKN